MYGIKLVTFSSDLVFDGEKRTPYNESEIKNPLNIYGRSKAISEDRVLHANPDSLIIRTSAFFSPWDQYNFLHWVEKSCNNESKIVVANDVYISPTYVPDLVNATLDLFIDDENGIWHLANEGAVTWADLAYLTAERRKYSSSLIQAIPSDEMNLTAQRPLYTVLGTERGLLMPRLENALNRYFSEKKPELALVL
jgi:dTDP-4-dehydrorhamnose reductase